MNHHLTSLAVALQAIDAQAPRLQAWGATAASALLAGGRLLVCGTGGDEAQVRHLVAALAQPEDDRPALAVSALTAPAAPASGSDGRAGVGLERGAGLESQVREAGRPGDILFCICATGSSDDLAACARAAQDLGIVTWALTGPGPNQVARACADAVAVPAAAVTTAEEVHLAAIHIFCSAADSAVRDALRTQATAPAPACAPRPVRQSGARLRPGLAG
jgi:D-sedoheptulose 7-phosphate isomerase